jgi:prepilin-type N-terminal cleavage/methylation domain-containing protein
VTLRRAFTLVELLVSITVLLIILGAVARIFSTASKVSGLGEASADLQSSATAIERMIRSDIERLNREGFMAIQCIAVRNDVNRAVYGNLNDASVPLLDPNRPADEYLRCDQIVFFTDRQQATAQYQAPGGAGNTGLNDGYGYGVRVKPQQGGTEQAQLTPESGSWNAMVRIGIGLQLPLLQTDNTKSEVPLYFPDPLSVGKGSGSTSTLISGSPLTPWTYTKPAEGPQLEVSYFNMAAPNNSKGYATQPEPRRWTLARQSILMADDGGARRISDGTAADGALYHRGQRIQRTVGGVSMAMRPNSAVNIFQIGPLDRTASTPKEVDATAMLTLSSGTPPGAGDAQILPERWITNSRVDIAATTIRDLRGLLETRDASGIPLSWLAEMDSKRVGGTLMPSLRQRVASACFGGSGQGVANQSNEGLWGFVRAERASPSMSRADSMLVAPTLSGNCSSLQIDWTWKPGVGRVLSSSGAPQFASVVVPNGNGGVNRVSDVALPGVLTSRFPALSTPLTGRPKGGGAGGVPAAADDPLTNNPIHRIPWFGLPDSLFPPQQRTGVTMLSGALAPDGAATGSVATTWASAIAKNAANPVLATPISVLDPAKRFTVPAGKAIADDTKCMAVVGPPIDVSRIEGTRGILRPLGNTIPVFVYQAVFGFNGADPLTVEPGATRDETASLREVRNDYTPWPTALRFTMTLHDPKLALSAGRSFQFVVDLPNVPK